MWAELWRDFIFGWIHDRFWEMGFCQQKFNGTLMNAIVEG